MVEKPFKGQALQILPSNGSAARSDTGSLICTSLGNVIQRGHEETTSIIAASDAKRAAEKRRKDRKEQYHSQVWTKAAHGGPYRKVRLAEQYLCSQDPSLSKLLFDDALGCVGKDGFVIHACIPVVAGMRLPDTANGQNN